MTAIENPIENRTEPFLPPVQSVELEAKELHTNVYLDEGFIDFEDLNEDGLYEDEYTHRSEPILVRMGDKEATLRLIHADKKEGGLLSLPTTKHFAVDPSVLKEVAEINRLSELKPREVVELSGLAAIKVSAETTRAEAFDATRQTYAQSLRRSLDQGHRLWVMNVDERFTQFLDMRLGTDSYKRLGEPQEYMGPATTPIAMNPPRVVESILKDDKGRYREQNRADIQNVMHGVNEQHLSPELIKLLHDQKIATTPEKMWKRISRHKKAGFYGGIVGYSAIRAFPVGAVEQFDGNVPVFLGIDVGTAVTQVASMELFFRGKNRLTRIMGAVGTGASFAAPYAYFYANGNDYPWYVNAVAGGFVALGAGVEVDRGMRDAKLKSGLEASDLETKIEN